MYFYFDRLTEKIAELPADMVEREDDKIYPRKRGFYFDKWGCSYLNLRFDPVFEDEASALEYAQSYFREKRKEAQAKMEALHDKIADYELAELEMVRRRHSLDVNKSAEVAQ